METGQLVIWTISGKTRKGIFMIDCGDGFAEVQCLSVEGRRMVIKTKVEVNLLQICPD